MKNKAPLSLMEQLCMLLVFSLAAALCLQIFVLSSQISHRCENRARAVTEIQNIAEAVKHCKGDVSNYPALLGGCGDKELWQIAYDENWQEAALDDAAFFISIQAEYSEIPTLGSARIFAVTEKGDELFSINLAWQEVRYE